MNSYFRPASLTWWSGVSLIGTGGALMAMPDSYLLTELGRLLTLFAGGADASPAMLIFTGTGLVGIRAKLERAYAGKPE